MPSLGREERLEVVVHLPDEGFERDVSLPCYLGVEVADGVEGVVVGFQKHAVERAGLEGFSVELRAETEVESVGEELLELQGIATVAVPDDGLSGMEFAANAQHVVDGTNTMKDERFMELLAKQDFLAKDLELQVVGRVAKAVEPTLADGEPPSVSHLKGEFPRVATLGVNTILNDPFTP